MANFRAPVLAAHPFLLVPSIAHRFSLSKASPFSGDAIRQLSSLRLAPFVHDQKTVLRSARAVQPDRVQPTSEDFVVVSDEKYGNKQVISISPRTYDYILDHVREPAILKELREETAGIRGSQMQVSPDQAQLLAILVQILGAKWCIEIGVYTKGTRLLRLLRHIGRWNSSSSEEGYSSLAVALVLPIDGRLVACERDERCLEIAKKYYERAGVSHKVAVKHGLAADALQSMIKEGEASSYDFAFVDADKRMYIEYYELLLKLVKPGGVIAIDNVLWHGKVADPLVNDNKTIAIRNFNKFVYEDKRVCISMVPIGDGMMICRKL